MNKSFFSSMVTAIGIASVIGLGAGQSAVAEAGGFPYPRNGQSQEQQERDRYECHRWAVQQSGYDPTTNVSAHASSGPGGAHRRGSSTGFLGIGGDRNAVGGEGGLVSDTATGAAFGAIGGALAGDAGVGALVGAGAGALLGQLFRQGSSPPARQHQAEAPPPHPGLENYRAAYGNCMSARGYEFR